MNFKAISSKATFQLFLFIWIFLVLLALFNERIFFMDFPRTLYHLISTQKFNLTFHRITEAFLQFPTVFLMILFGNKISLKLYLYLTQIIYFLPSILAVTSCFYASKKDEQTGSYLTFSSVLTLAMVFGLASSHSNMALAFFWIYLSIGIQTKNLFLKLFLLLMFCFTYEGSIILLLPLIPYELLIYLRKKSLRQIIILSFHITVFLFLAVYLFFLKNSYHEIKTTFAELKDLPLFIVLNTIFTACVLSTAKRFLKKERIYNVYLLILLIFSLIICYFAYRQNSSWGPWEYYKAKPYSLFMASILTIPLLFGKKFTFDKLDNRFLQLNTLTIIILLSVVEVRFNFNWNKYLTDVESFKANGKGCYIAPVKMIQSWEWAGASITNLPHLSLLLQKKWNPDYIVYPSSFNNENPCEIKSISGKKSIGYLEHQWLNEKPESQEGRFIVIEPNNLFDFNHLIGK